MIGGEGRPNRYRVRVVEEGRGWHVEILEPDGRVVFTRACRDEAEARTRASTVEQHIYWLSPGKFENYYRLSEPA